MIRAYHPSWLAGAVGVALAPAALADSSVFCHEVDVLGAPASFVVAAPSGRAAEVASGWSAS
jgi:hypothetical protein